MAEDATRRAATARSDGGVASLVIDRQAWERRVREARAQRERALAQRAAPGDAPRPSPPRAGALSERPDFTQGDGPAPLGAAPDDWRDAPSSVAARRSDGRIDTPEPPPPDPTPPTVRRAPPPVAAAERPAHAQAVTAPGSPDEPPATPRPVPDGGADVSLVARRGEARIGRPPRDRRIWPRMSAVFAVGLGAGLAAALVFSRPPSEPPAEPVAVNLRSDAPAAVETAALDPEPRLRAVDTAPRVPEAAPPVLGEAPHAAEEAPSAAEATPSSASATSPSAPAAAAKPATDPAPAAAASPAAPEPELSTDPPAPVAEDPADAAPAPILESVPPRPEAQAEAASAEAAPVEPAPVDPAVVAGARVLVHAPAGATEADGVIAALRAQGYDVTGPVPVRVTVSRSNARFFHGADADVAAAVAEVVSGVPRDFTDFSPPPLPGLIEVWLAGTPQDGAAPAPPPAPARASEIRRAIDQGLRHVIEEARGVQPPVRRFENELERTTADVERGVLRALGLFGP